MKAAAPHYALVSERLAVPMSRVQSFRLRSLAQEAYQPQQYTVNLSSDEAARRIAALKAEIALADSF
jgi:hypothetical protein